MLTTWQAVSTLDRMLDDVMGSTIGAAVGSRTFQPAVDVRASEDDIVFMCDVPGVKQEDIDVTLENRVLTIKGARRFEGKPDEQVMLGRPYGSFSRSFSLPEYLDESNVEANLTNGVLTIRIAKQARAKPRKILVGNGSEAKQLEA